MNSDFTIEFNEYMPLKELVFTTLKKAILKGELQPGDRLMELQLAEKMGVSRTPIREAIHKLSKEGLVTLIPRKGAEVAGISRKMLTDVLQVRMNLEKMAFSLAFGNMEERSIHLMEKYHEEFKAAVAVGDILRMTEADESFHFVIYDVADNQKLREILENLKENMYRYRLEYLRNPDCRNMLISEHAEMVESIRNHDLNGGLSVVERHIANQENAVLLKLRQEEADKKPAAEESC